MLYFSRLFGKQLVYSALFAAMLH